MVIYAAFAEVFIPYSYNLLHQGVFCLLSTFTGLVHRDGAEDLCVAILLKMGGRYATYSVNKLLIITIEINLEQCYNDINWYNLS